MCHGLQRTTKKRQTHARTHGSSRRSMFQQDGLIVSAQLSIELSDWFLSGFWKIRVRLVVRVSWGYSSSSYPEFYADLCITYWYIADDELESDGAESARSTIMLCRPLGRSEVHSIRKNVYAAKIAYDLPPSTWLGRVMFCSFNERMI